MKCLNVSKQHNNKLNIQIGNNIVLQKVKNFTTTLLLENQTGNFPVKSNNISVNFNNKSENKKNLMALFKHSKNSLNKKKSKRKLFLFSNPNLSMLTQNGKLVSICVRMIKGGL